VLRELAAAAQSCCFFLYFFYARRPQSRCQCDLVHISPFRSLLSLQKNKLSKIVSGVKMLFQRPPYMAPHTYRRWRRRQLRLVALMGVLLVVVVGLVARGIMLLPPATAVTMAGTTPSPLPTVIRSPTATPRPPPPAPTIHAAAGILMDVDDGRVLFKAHENDQLPMASTTKVMTALIALKRGHLDQPITIGADAVAEGLGDNSHMGVREGEVISLEDMLYGLLLPSGDDAAVAIADALGGSEAGFVAMMNAEAKIMGLTHTHFVNPDGLDAAGHYTSVSDLLKLTRRALAIPEFALIVNTVEHKIPATSQHHAYDLFTTNALLNNYPGADGVKTGTTPAAAYCLVFSATRNSGHLLGVLLGDPTEKARYLDAQALLDWGFQVIASS
jgi:D-alanyl-D-alanine carboxypeptidase (penicillin-binding protein 5/6)